jgi:thioredoxin 2
MKHVVCGHCSAINRVPADREASAAKCGKCGAAVFSGKPVNLSSASFDRHISRSDIPVVVDFWADWCGPCKMMAPAYAQAAAELEPEVRLAKLDTEAANDVAARFNIRSIPTLIVFREGREVARQAGAMPAPQLAAWIRENT